MPKRFLSLVILLFTAIPCWSQTVNVATLQQLLDNQRTTNCIPGALLSVIPTNGGTPANLISGVATLNSSAPAPMATTDLFRIGSVTKTFVATVVLQLVSEGKLSLNSTLTQVLGASAVAAVPNADQITIQQLLNMTSGIYDYLDSQFQTVVFANPGKVWTPQEIINSINGKSPVFTPGATCAQCPCSCAQNTNCWSYSNTNYILLGMMIEKVTGNPVGTELTLRIFKPLGLSSTSFATTTAFPSGSKANGYGQAGLTAGCGGAIGMQCPNATICANPPMPTLQLNDTTSCFNPSVAWTAGAIISNFPDLSKWLTALVSGSLLTPEMQKARLTMVAGDLEGIPIEYGLGIMQIELTPGVPFLGHGGEFWGYANVLMQSASCNTQILDMVSAFPQPNGCSTYFDLIASAAGQVCGSATKAPAATPASFKVRKPYNGLFIHE